MKKCSHCKKILPDNNFYPLITGKVQFSYCKKCNRERSKKKYNNNKDYYILKAKKYLDIYKERINKLYKKYKNKPCVDCGQTYPKECMDFDHLPDYEKRFCISQGVSKKFSIQHLEEEIKKCEVVCSNCHRIRTAKRHKVRLGEMD